MLLTAKRFSRSERQKRSTAMWIYLKVPFAEKDDAKALGARFDPERKLWYATDKVNFRHFKKWMNPDVYASLERYKGRTSTEAKLVHQARKALG